MRVAIVSGGEVIRLDEPEPVVERPAWVPVVGVDRRDLRDPEKVGREYLRRRRRKRKT